MLDMRKLNQFKPEELPALADVISKGINKFYFKSTGQKIELSLCEAYKVIDSWGNPILVNRFCDGECAVCPNAQIEQAQEERDES